MRKRVIDILFGNEREEFRESAMSMLGDPYFRRVIVISYFRKLGRLNNEEAFRLSLEAAYRQYERQQR